MVQGLFHHFNIDFWCQFGVHFTIKSHLLWHERCQDGSDYLINCTCYYWPKALEAKTQKHMILRTFICWSWTWKAHTHTHQGCLTICEPQTVFVGVVIFNATFCNSFRSLFRFLWYIQLRCYVLVLVTLIKGFWISAWDLLLDALFFLLVENQHVNTKRGTTPKKQTWNPAKEPLEKKKSYWKSSFSAWYVS